MGVSDRGREREEIYDQERQAWELKHRAAVERAERAEASHAKATAEGARALNSQQAEQGMHVRAEDRCTQLERTVEELHRKAAGVTAEHEEKLAVVKNFSR